MSALTPSTPEELAQALRAAAEARRSIQLGGRFSKQAMAGPLAPADVIISTAGLARILQYQPRDLTVSIEAGAPFAELARVTAQDGLMIPLDPPLAHQATVGGVVAANLSGSRRLRFGTARNMVIGMRFATLEGKLVSSGGMVVKNAAGLDLAKLMIGSFGTLAAIAAVNFKLVPMPAFSRTFLFRHDSLEAAVAARDNMVRGVLQPAAIDLLNPQASARLGREGYLVAVQAGGNAAVIERYTRELAGAETLEGAAEEALWHKIRDFTPQFLAAHPDGAVVRLSCLLSQLEAVMASLDVPALARAGSGVCYGYFAECATAAAWLKEASLRGWKGVIEFAPPAEKEKLNLWPCPGDDLPVMQRVKAMFDPHQLLNRGRLYGRI